MTDCQRKQMMLRLNNYENQAREHQKLLKEQQDRVRYFQGLITQLRKAMEETPKGLEEEK